MDPRQRDKPRELRYKKWHIRVIPSTITGEWIAWASKQKLHATNPLFESATDVWFTFASSESAALKEIRDELDKEDIDRCR